MSLSSSFEFKELNSALKMTNFFGTTEGALMVMYTEKHTVQFTFVHIQILSLTFAR